MQELEQKKFEERLDFAIELLKNKFGHFNNEMFMNKAVEIAIALFVRSEIAYQSKK